MDLIGVLVVLALLATCSVMLLGLITMSGRKVTDELASTPLMWARIGLQGLTILLLLLALWLR